MVDKVSTTKFMLPEISDALQQRTFDYFTLKNSHVEKSRWPYAARHRFLGLDQYRDDALYPLDEPIPGTYSP
jgi:hypothetical protein